ncbi:fibronectin type III domain-containing protein, partial [bacterium]|nr:fibronectin type III domain-containing protein [bacterium]
SVTASGFTVNWTAVTGASSYRLDIATDSGFTSFVSGFSNLTVSGTSQAVTGLSAATAYYARVRTVNSGGTSANSQTGNQATLLANDLSSDAATVTVNGVAVSGTLVGATYTAVGSVISDSKNDVWYKFQAPASGTATITTGSYSATPDLDLYVWDSSGSAWSGTTPTAAADFSATGSLTTSESVSATVTAGRTYYVRVRIWSGTGTFTITATMPVAPSGQATNFTSSSITFSAATVGWTRGNGDGVLVVARAGGAVNTDPTDGTNYTANAAFGSGTQIGTGNYVVYKGTGTSVNVTGLSAATTYYFELYEYNTNGLMHNMSGLIGNLTTSNRAPTVTTSA